MRALLYALIFANLLFFAWAHWVDAPRAGPHQLAPLQLVASATPAADAPASADPRASRCASLGPLGAGAESAALKTALQARDVQARERQMTAQETEGYWVYIDKLATTQERANALQRLHRAGVRDAAALAESGQVSVGLFSEQAGADKRAAAVRAAGFEPVIEVRAHSVEQYWLDVNLPGDVPLPAVAALVAGLNLSSKPQWGACP
jgi:hypothetical protein